MKRIIKLLICILSAMLLSHSAFSLVNPSYTYCNSLGYIYDSSNGKCIISDGIAVDAWDFMDGKIAQEHSFCAQEGYEIKTIRDKEKCSVYGTEECAVCVVDGKETEISEAMNLNFEETFCGDANCGLPENSKTCPEDCPKGGFDLYCDGGDDPDCAEPLTEEMILREYEEKKMAEKELEEAKQKETARKKLIKNGLLFSIGLIILAGIIFIAKKLKKGKIQESKKYRSK